MEKILLVSPYWREEHRWMVSTVKLAELWQRLGYRVVVCCMGSSSRVENVSDSLTIHYRKDFFLKDPWNYGIAFGFSGYVLRLARAEKPDHIVVNKLLFWSTFSVLLLRLTGRKVTILTDALVGMTWWPRGFVTKVAAAIYAWTAGWLLLLVSSRVVFFHPQPERLMALLGIKNKVSVIPTGIDERDLGLRTEDLGVQANKVTVTYVGRLESVKGVDDFLEAVVPLQKNYPQLDIQVVGWHKANHPLVSKFERDVTFTGLRDDVAAILSTTDIFVLPSYSEGLSNALMEAMASGCACVASEVGGNRFLIQNGVSGFLFPPGDREALRSHVQRLIEDDAKRVQLGEKAQERIREHFDWSVVGKQYQTLFDEA
jgi:glycosyltransferase involved in cell wall biosynthesis